MQVCLNKWDFNSHPCRPDRVTAYGRFLPIFCRVVESIDPIRALCAPLNAEVVDSTETALLGWARCEMQKRKIKKQQ